MQLVHTFPFVIALVATTLIALFVGTFALRRIRAPGARPMVGLAVAIAIWASAYAMELSQRSPEAMLFWARIEYLGIVVVPVAWLWYALQYTGRDRDLNWFNLAQLLIIPTFSVILIWTNDRHGLFYRGLEFSPLGTATIFTPVYGTWFWVHTVYSYALVLIGGGMLLRLALRTHPLYRRQAMVLVLGALAPFIGNMAYLSLGADLRTFDITPMLFVFSLLIVAWGLTREQLLETFPVARDLVIEQMRDGVIVINEHAMVVDVNPAAQAMLDSPVRDLIGQRLTDLVPQLQGLLTGNPSLFDVHDEIFMSVNDQVRCYDVRVVPLAGWNRQARGRLVLWRDITEQRDADLLLRRQHAELTALNETALALLDRQDLAHVLDTILRHAADLVETRHGYITVVDPAAGEQVVEVAIGLLADQVGRRIKPGEGLVGRVWQLGRAYTVRDYASWEGRLFQTDALHTMLGLPLQSDNMVIGVIGLSYDQAELTFDPQKRELLARFAKLASLALDNARLYADLQLELLERKRTEADLYDAKEAAESANRAKSTFVANISHELRTPLTSIIGYAQLMRMQIAMKDYVPLGRAVETIERSSQHLLEMINQILNLAKIEAGRMELYIEEFEIQALLNEVVIMVRPLLDEHRNALVMEAEPDLGRAHTDRGKLRQILINLLGNAAKFTEQGTITLRAARVMDEEGAQLELQVADTGIGIPAPALPTLFTEFTQIPDSSNGSSKARYGGTGLGLAICKHYTASMGGSISVESQEGQGSTFTVRIPLTIPQPARHVDARPDELVLDEVQQQRR